MRRLLALLALVSMSWSQVAAVRCVLGATAVHGSGGVASHHATPLDVQEDPGLHLVVNVHAGAPAPSGTACGLVMTCGMAMTEAIATSDELKLPAPRAADRPPATDAPAAAFLPADPPPPRRLV